VENFNTDRVCFEIRKTADRRALWQMNFKRHKNKAKVRKIALERIALLLSQADEVYKEDYILALRYGDLARKIAMKARVKIPQKWRMRFCSRCKKLLFPGITAKVRLKRGTHSRIVYSCSFCEGQGKSVKVFKTKGKKTF